MIHIYIIGYVINTSIADTSIINGMERKTVTSLMLRNSISVCYIDISSSQLCTKHTPLPSFEIKHILCGGTSAIFSTLLFPSSLRYQRVSMINNSANIPYENIIACNESKYA